MIPFGTRNQCPAVPAAAVRRSTLTLISGRLLLAVAALLALATVGWSVAVSLGSALLAIVAVGMLSLMIVAVAGTVIQASR